MATYSFTNAVGLGSPYPEAPPEMQGTINDFGFPAVLRRVHRGLRACMNKIPRNDPNTKAPIRAKFLECIAQDLNEQETVDRFCSKLGFESARRDLMERRISEMTVVDFIVDEKLATPTAESVREMTNTLLQPDRERFARMKPKAGAVTDEWDEIDEPDSPGM
jgi:hypothetical protein